MASVSSQNPPSPAVTALLFLNKKRDGNGKKRRGKKENPKIHSKFKNSNIYFKNWF
jgi:hypothetical protein